jgi:hypothetical protein
MTPAEQDLSRRLDSGERLLWFGMPRQGVRFAAADFFLVPFSLAWCGFFVFWETMAIASRAPWPMALFGAPFLAVGLYFVVGRFFVDARVRARTYYGLTDRRVVIVAGLLSRRVVSLGLKDLGGMELTEHSDGSGTIAFGPQFPFAATFHGTSWPGMSRMKDRTFDQIESARDVHARIQQARDDLA